MNYKESSFSWRAQTSTTRYVLLRLVVEVSSNFASTLLVRESGLPTQKHPKPYNVLMYLSPAVIKVEEQVLVPISMGWYADVILCDVIPLFHCFMILGRSWQYDQRTSHDGYNNTYSFQFFDKMVTLYPDYEAQTAMKHVFTSIQDMYDNIRENGVITQTTSPSPKQPYPPTNASLRSQRLRSKPIRFRDYISR